ncbi:LysR substrate-binding domain-containing protein [Falsiporphyromonas endometrii]|uniref:LysR substrate-binding domain-containing protein n=1 Tax=Falsiporphyromonas endometrii TaxID=1387297 RepID=A0ABV9K5M2_9PORP
MNIQQLEYIIALDKHRHFAKAAEDCNVTQPTLSTMVKKFELELGVDLFQRNRSAVIPTEIGVLIIDQAKRVISESRKIQAIVVEEENSMSGRIRMALLPTIAPYLMPVISDMLTKALPKVEFDFSELLTSQCLQALSDNSIDIAIIASKSEMDDLKEIPLYYEQFLGYVSKNEALFEQTSIRTNEVDGERLWLLDEGHCFRDQLVKFCNLKSFVNKHNTYRHGSMATFMSMVETGQGVTFIPELAYPRLSDAQKELVRPFAIPRPSREINLCYRGDFVRQHILNAIAETIKKAVPEEMLQLRKGDQLV